MVERWLCSDWPVKETREGERREGEGGKEGGGGRGGKEVRRNSDGGDEGR